MNLKVHSLAFAALFSAGHVYVRNLMEFDQDWSVCLDNGANYIVLSIQGFKMPKKHDSCVFHWIACSRIVSFFFSYFASFSQVIDLAHAQALYVRRNFGKDWSHC